MHPGTGHCTDSADGRCYVVIGLRGHDPSAKGLKRAAPRASVVEVSKAVPRVVARLHKAAVGVLSSVSGDKAKKKRSRCCGLPINETANILTPTGGRTHGAWVVT